jgi:hypothetical protein
MQLQKPNTLLKSNSMIKWPSMQLQKPNTLLKSKLFKFNLNSKYFYLNIYQLSLSYLIPLFSLDKNKKL